MRKAALILPVLAGIMFGSGGVFVRTLTAYGMGNQTVFFSRIIFALAMITLLILIYNRKLFRVKLKDLPIFLGTGILGMTGINMCYNEAVVRLPLSLSAVLLCTAPIFVVFLAAICFKEKITGKKVGCMAVAIIGCALASGVIESLTGGAGLSFLGVLAGVGSAIFYAAYSIFSKLATDKGYHTYTVIFYTLIFAVIVMLPFVDYDVFTGYIADAPLEHTLFLIAHSLCLSVLPYILITAGMLYADAGMVSILASGSEPVAATIFGAIFFDEIPTILMIAGIVITIAALTFLCMKPKHIGDTI